MNFFITSSLGLGEPTDRSPLIAGRRDLKMRSFASWVVELSSAMSVFTQATPQLNQRNSGLHPFRSSCDEWKGKMQDCRNNDISVLDAHPALLQITGTLPDEGQKGRNIHSIIETDYCLAEDRHVFHFAELRKQSVRNDIGRRHTADEAQSAIRCKKCAS
jgi:hypothetical protein